MATADEALQKMRTICLSLPSTSEGKHFGQAAFYVNRKLFATCGAKRGICEISFGLETDHAAALAARSPHFRIHPRDKRGVVVEVAKVKSWTEIEALLRESYDLVTTAKPRKKKVAAPKKKVAAPKKRVAAPKKKVSPAKKKATGQRR